MNRIIVTGGNGFIGKHLVKKLLSRTECSVVVISNNPNFDDEQIAEGESYYEKKLTFHTADIRDRNTVSQIIRDERADTCIHLAAKLSVPDSIKNPEESMEVNVKGTLNVLDACHNGKVRNFIFASSAAVYGDVKNLPISEDHALKPLSPYGESKMLAEQHVWEYTRLRKIQKSISLRLFNVYGIGQTAGCGVVADFAERLSKGLAPIISGDGSHTRDFISVDDVTEAILLSLGTMENKYKNDFNSRSIFNIGTGIATSITGLAKIMIAISGLDLNPLYEVADTGSGVILHSYADMTKAKKHLQFSVKKDLETGLREIIEQTRK